ncbi:MAG: cell filamentation protein Fic [Oscillospiraceae bacterium]|nr:cell filamentation protein Fic [Oscillospiraceae bacterium]
MIKFSKEKVLLLHKILAEATGGSVGLRDEALLQWVIDHRA